MKFLVVAIIGIMSMSGVLGVIMHRTGPPTSERDDAVSQVTCPDGSYIVKCSCSSMRDCDSNLVVGNNICRVTHTGQRPVVKPIATCETLYRVVRSTAYSKTPTITCPDGLVVRSCGYYNPWAHAHYVRIKPQKFKENQCVLSAPCSRHVCLIQAVCVDPRLIM
ncbi:uncharacterized protein LOC141912102 [Tubulanus polymorphus]|uniref:uncharacterized protein LOC141912102 n=1 Tax=Tubulanus polymorphus TaxID=672921 RepID=UPI003DA27CCB